MRPFSFAWLVFALPSAVAPTFAGGGEGKRESAPIRYDRDVRPILSDRCFVCHGPDAKKRQADLRLDSFEAATAVRPDGAAIVPGKPKASELVRRIAHADPGERMPPEDSNRKALSADERLLLERWIAEGARYEAHWSFVAPLRPPVPAVREAAGCRNDVDRFIRARLEDEGLRASPEAPPEAQLRRLFLDVTGLPPTPEELAAFRADARADRYELMLDRLFAEEPYRSRAAERLATPWMDQARYADTSGIHMDAGRQMWLWRDWVLQSYRDNLPFDRFVTEQLAGDLLPDASESQVIASGFNRNHVTTDEGGAIDEEYKVEYAVDRTATTGSVFLGLTLGCARCHEHKFDPVSQDEFYSLYSFFNSNDEPGLYSQVPDANRALEPFLVVPTPEQKARRAELDAALAAERTARDEPPAGEDETRARFFAELTRESGLEWVASLLASARSLEGATLTPQADGSALASGENPDQDEHEFRLTTPGTGLSLLALEALPDPSFVEGRVGRAFNGNAVLSGITAEAISRRDPAQRQTLHFTWAWADHEQEDGEFGITGVLDPDEHGWAVGAHQVPGGRAALFATDEPFGFEGGTEVVVRLAYRSIYAQHTLGRVRLALGKLLDAGRERLPVAATDWLVAGPFET